MTSKFFNNYSNEAEQNLVHNLIIEAIHIYGHDVFYIPRTGVNKDDILNEYEYSTFNDALQTEVYVKNFNAFEGDGVLLEKFGLEVRDQLVLTIATRTFEKDVETHTTLSRPREGDLLWIPFLKTAYEIRFVETTSMFYQFGEMQTYDVVTELFEYSQEVFSTGIPDIDQHFSDRYAIAEEFYLTDENGNVFVDEENYELILPDYAVDDLDFDADNSSLDIEEEDILDWSEHNPFGEL